MKNTFRIIYFLITLSFTIFFLIKLFAFNISAIDKSNSIPQTINELRDADFTPVMIYVSAGTFKMGDNFAEGYPDEQPAHEVYVNGFYIGKFEVTNAQFAFFIADSGYCTKKFWSDSGWSIKLQQIREIWDAPKWWNHKDQDKKHGGPKWLDFPVVGVSWYEAEAYCNWLTFKTGYAYRLPTEAEWEKTARGTDQRRYPWGNKLDSCRVNFWKSGDPFDNKTTPVGYYDGSMHGKKYRTLSNASPYGAYDMAGNVWEYCLDWYDGLFYSRSPRRNPRNVALGAFRVIRGGSWDYNEDDVRVSSRDSAFPSYRDDNIGFRCVREIK